MKKMEIMIVADYSEKSLLDAETLCMLSHCSSEMLALLIQYDIIKPAAHRDHQWLFDTETLMKLKMALRLQHDFDLNISGLALVMDLITEREMLSKRNAMLERHLFGKKS